MKTSYKNALKYTGVFIIASVFISALVLLPKPECTPLTKQDIITANATANNVVSIDAITHDIEQKPTEKLSIAEASYSVEIGKTVTSKITYIPNDTNGAIQSPHISWHSNNPNIASVDSDGNITGVSAGTTGIIAVTSTGATASCYVTVSIPTRYIIDDVPLITQTDKYPSGCESVSTTMFLQYYGFDIEPEDFIDNYLPKAYLEDGDNGELTGPDTESVFIGDPYSEDSLGCYPPVIVNAINQFAGAENKKAVDVTGSSLNSLITNYVAVHKPVLIWATMYMWEPVVTYEWTVKNATEYSSYKDGDPCQWLANEHCMVLVGYDEDYYYFNDPNYEEAPVSYERELFETRYKQIGMGAVILEDTTN
ncbi:MAG TPA: hypothetical protein GX401_04170 [Clostridiales bacterium]|nr:hypothetical protein [Clostridiales bacterium]